MTLTQVTTLMVQGHGMASVWLWCKPQGRWLLILRSACRRKGYHKPGSQKVQEYPGLFFYIRPLEKLIKDSMRNTASNSRTVVLRVSYEVHHLKVLLPLSMVTPEATSLHRPWSINIHTPASMYDRCSINFRSGDFLHFPVSWNG